MATVRHYVNLRAPRSAELCSNATLAPRQIVPSNPSSIPSLIAIPAAASSTSFPAGRPRIIVGLPDNSNFHTAPQTTSTAAFSAAPTNSLTVPTILRNSQHSLDFSSSQNLLPPSSCSSFSPVPVGFALSSKPPASTSTSSAPQRSGAQPPSARKSWTEKT